MATGDRDDTAAIGEEFEVRIPLAVRSRIDVDPGDTIRWRIADDGVVELEFVDQEYGAFDDFEPVDLGSTNSAEDHDLGAVDHPE